MFLGVFLKHWTALRAEVAPQCELRHNGSGIMLVIAVKNLVRRVGVRGLGWWTLLGQAPVAVGKHKFLDVSVH